MEKVSATSHTGYVLINKLALPVGALIILIAIGWDSVELLGEYALVTTYFFIMQTIPLLGLATFIMREVARKPELAPIFFSTIGVIAIGGSVLVNGVVHSLLPYSGYSEGTIEAIRIVGLTIFPGIIIFISETLLTSLHKTRAIAVIAFVENILRVVLSIVVLYIYSDIVPVIWVLFFTRIGALLAYFEVLQKEGIQPLQRLPDVALIKRTFKVILPFLLNSILLLVISRMDFIILSLYETIDQIGLYAIGYRLFDISLLVITAVLSASFPWISKKFVGSSQHFNVAIKALLITLIMVLWPLSMLGYAGAEWYVYLLFPGQYSEPVLLTQLFMLLLAIGGIDLVLASILHATDHQVKDTRALVMGSIVYCVLLVILIPIWSIYGALMSLVGAVLVQGSMRLYFVKQNMPNLFSLGELQRLTFAAIGTVIFLCVIYDLNLFWQLIWIILFTTILFPIMLNQLKLFYPLRWICYFLKPMNHYDDVNSLAAVIAFLAVDSRRIRKFKKIKRPGWETSVYPGNLNFLAIVLYRLSRYFLLNKRNRLSRILWRMNLLITKCDIRAECRIDQGLLLISPVGIGLSAKIAKNATFFPFTGLGKSGERDIGAGAGCPVLDDNVTLSTNTGVLGAIYIEKNVEIPPHSFIRNNKDLKNSLKSR
jgi:O-antigen/teichoic acid export membrane protein/serine acetyltransferase